MFPSYPQHIFFKFLQRKIPRRPYGVIVDAPCGSGYITLRIAQTLDAEKVTGVDLDPDAIDSATTSSRRENVEFKVENIHSFLDNSGPIDIYLLINSIFLLPEPADILRKIYRKLAGNGHLAIVIPNIDSDNFRAFQRINPGQNSLILDKEQAKAFFEGQGFRTECIEGLAHLPVYGNTILSRIGRLRGLYTYSGDIINKFLGRKPSYWGFILSKR